MNRIAVILALMLTSLTASAQWDDWASYTVECQLSGSRDVWKISRYRDGFVSWEKPRADNGVIRWSDNCIEFSCNNLILYFDVKRYQKDGPKSFRVFRESFDERFDYIEVTEAIGTQNIGSYMVILGKLDDDGNIQGAIQLIAKPMAIAGKEGKFRPAVGGMR